MARSVLPGANGKKTGGKPARRRLLFRALLASAALGALLTFFGQAALVPTASMEHTVMVGDHLLILKLPYAPQIPFTGIRLPRLSGVKRGEIVVFQSPADAGVTFLKRAVAVAGDEVEIRGGQLLVNHRPVAEPYVIHRGQWQSARRENMAPRVVPAGELFMLGDNRENSEDSRFWGAIPESSVMGKPLFVLWSYDAPSSAWLEDRPLSKLRFYTYVATHFVSNTRWSRTGTVL
jgi:signal peptidase I